MNLYWISILIFSTSLCVGDSSSSETTISSTIRSPDDIADISFDDDMPYDYDDSQGNSDDRGEQETQSTSTSPFLAYIKERVDYLACMGYIQFLIMQDTMRKYSSNLCNRIQTMMSSLFFYKRFYHK